MTVEDFLAQFEGSVAVVNALGEAVTNGTIATGYKILLYNGENIIDECITVIYGDVDGNGIINVNDIVSVREHISGTVLSDAKLLAANFDKDEDDLVNVNDIVAIRDNISGITV